MIEVYYLIYYRFGGNNPEYRRILPRHTWDFRKRKINARNAFFPSIPRQHQETLDAYYDEWFYVPSLVRNENAIEFTYGVDEESGISAIAIKYPLDNFNKKIGRAMVEGRIKRMKGEIEGREPYDLNEFFLVHKEE